MAQRSEKPKPRALTIRFTEPEDLDLYERMEAEAKKNRYPLAVYALLGLHGRFPGSEPDVPVPDAADLDSPSGLSESDEAQ